MGPTVLPENKNSSASFFTKWNPNFQPCHRIKGNLIIFDDINNNSCVHVLLVETSKQFTIPHKIMGI